MGRSIVLWAYLLAAKRARPGVSRPRGPRPQGRVIWLHAGHGASLTSLGQLAQRLAREKPRTSLLITAEGAAPGLEGFPKETSADVLPPDTFPDVRGFLDHWLPDLAVIAGSDLPPALIVATHDRAVPLVLVDASVPAAISLGQRLKRGMTGSLLSRFARLLVQDPGSARGLRLRGAPIGRVEIAGRIEESNDPLTCNEAEREALAELLQARPVWFAAACPEAEEEAVIAAQAHVLRLAHRMLLIIAPANAARAPALVERLAREGWVAALRSADEEPDPEVQAYVVDTEGEMGLWYRLAPLTCMGGTLLPGGSGRNPFEPAALGSAIVHGPHLAPYPDAYARLAEARATRSVATPQALTAAIAELMAPDRAALLAHNAWAVTSGGAEVTERVTQAILETLAARTASAPEAA
ncbi:3-deoxy-D-manno-octulosonic acid transferase [Albidovulum sediminicola]|uniref:3-deoxy-D-manno-octulosonic acid transferase n=1 Tax=Albidovulum sediminicola TaxID=2984331 RepID=A0ABT2YX44_9RHOB|nr:glycosyltransferase N-terminal domain-containing protein [Defluviimonas sp. WL0075]MCV2863421.1 3-deoxy-D-manno-octulosonic acid transferase [Defluviimonas sp. WL0075]